MTFPAKYERRVAKNLISGGIFVDSPMPTSPVPAVIVDQTTSATAYSETVRFSFANEELYSEYSIANGLISVPIRGQQVPLPIGNGTLEMTKVTRTALSSVYHSDKWYDRYNNTYILEFKHPAGPLLEEIRQAIQVAEPES